MQHAYTKFANNAAFHRFFNIQRRDPVGLCMRKIQQHFQHLDAEYPTRVHYFFDSWLIVPGNSGGAEYEQLIEQISETLGTPIEHFNGIMAS